MREPHPGKSVRKSMFALHPVSVPHKDVLDQDLFQKTLALERKRTERSRKPFLLMLLETRSDLRMPTDIKAAKEIVSALAKTTRETDVVGWYQRSSVLGVIFTELGAEQDIYAALKIMSLRVRSTLSEHLTVEQINNISLSFYMFPEDGDSKKPDHQTNPTLPLHPDLLKRDQARKFFCIVKRVMDVLGSVLVLIVSSPVFLLIALVIKLTSGGPVLYRQQRVGQYGVPFAILKFRSMYENNDSSLHREYVLQLIAGVAARQPANAGSESVYKLTCDSRITSVGAFLRRTSLDELPQVINVLKGEMSLVGPRPPIHYEVERYELWHRRRLFEVKPGITGLWQVSGRNRLTFDDMVRLDLKYAKAWTPWLDLKIIFQTPRAIIEGAH